MFGDAESLRSYFDIGRKLCRDEGFTWSEYDGLLPWKRDVLMAVINQEAKEKQGG